MEQAQAKSESRQEAEGEGGYSCRSSLALVDAGGGEFFQENCYGFIYFGKRCIKYTGYKIVNLVTKIPAHSLKLSIW